MKIPFLAWLLQGIPESIALAALVMSMGFIRLKWRRIIVIGLIQAVSAYILRLLPLPFFSHYFLLIPILAINTWLITGLDIRLAHLFSTLTFLFLVIVEAAMLFLITSLNNLTLEIISSNVALRIICGMPQTIILFLTGWVINFVKNHVNLKKLMINIDMNT